jgi:hypothetical protein
VVVFFGSFYLINLMLAVVALSYEEEAEITQEVCSLSLAPFVCVCVLLFREWAARRPPFKTKRAVKIARRRSEESTINKI